MTGNVVYAVDSTAVEVVGTAEAVETVPAEPAVEGKAVETVPAEPAVEPEAVETAPVEPAVEPEAVSEQPAEETAEATPEAGALQLIPLTDADCVKCHYAVAVDVDAHGEAHKELSCMECHEEHPPVGTNAIPECSNCHTEDDNAHFAVQQCGACHNPHHPLLVDFTASDDARSACASCHQEQVDELAANPSAHTEQDCNACHSQHGLEQGQYQTCLDCHEGHTPEMILENCLECHKPHSPLNIIFDDTVAVELCAGCHQDKATALTTLQTKHSEMACVECHSGKHKNITACVDCHDQPHDQYMHTKFPECITCHRDPHNLAR